MNFDDNDTTPETKPFLYFGGYCLGGLSILTYIVYRGIMKAAVKVKIDRPKGQRLQLSNMKSAGGVWKGLLAGGLYLGGFMYLASQLNLKDRAFRSMIKKDREYTDKVKLDPVFQKFFIIDAMQYFHISDRLIKKTEDELKEKIQKSGGQELKHEGLVSLQKQVLTFLQNFTEKKETKTQ